MEHLFTLSKTKKMLLLVICALAWGYTSQAQDTQETISLIELTSSDSETDSLTYDIPNYLMISKSYKGHPIVEVDFKQFVSGGKEPYTFRKVSGPDWMLISSEGIVSGTPTAIGDNADLVTEVTDDEGNTKQASIMVGSTSLKPEDREKITEMETTSDDFSTIPKFGGSCSSVNFTVTKGSPARVEATNMGSWHKKEGDGWSQKKQSDIFTAGTYRYEVQIRVDGEAGKTHVLGEGFTFKMNGESWTVLDPLTVTDTYSYIWVQSPEIVITEPEDQPLTFMLSDNFAIDKSYRGRAIDEISVAGNAYGGEKPYTFSKISGPEWINVSSEGVISGTPTAVGANDNLVIRVTDKAGTYQEATIAVGETKIHPEDREDVSLIEATCEDIYTIPTVGNSCSLLNFTVTSGSPAHYSIVNCRWYKYNEENGSLGIIPTSSQFEAGKYIYYACIMISGDDNETHKLASNVQLKVNGTEWSIIGYVRYSDTYSYAFFQSPVIEIVDTGIGNITIDGKPAVIYNLKGQRVDENYKGVVIINGKKVVRK